MIKCFLSHSSHDKTSYVRLVASKIKKEAKVFDEETFEEGMSPLEEIIKGIDESTLFVIFLSNASLNSVWVKNEVGQAKSLLDSSKIERIYPIIIEAGIDHNDPRIPVWMKDSLNIQPILKTSIAARKINARLTELSWKSHPRLKERKEIFAGRNDLLKEIEERFDDFQKKTPIVLIASGLPSIGRRTLIQFALQKANLVRESYEFPVVSLNQHDGIEDFILKIDDLGLSSTKVNREQLNGTFEEKIHLAKEIAKQISAERERIIIEDRGVIVQGNGNIVDWFIDVVNAISATDHLTFNIASQYRPKLAINRTNPLFFAIPVKEMELAERNGLLVRYSKFHQLNLSKEDYEFFADLLTGYPEQVLFTVDLIHEQGLFNAKKQSHIIQQYSSDKAKVVLDQFKNDNEILAFIYLLSKFEFISYEVLFDIVDESIYTPKLEKLLSSSICEKVGTSADYIRVNDAVRDYIGRSNFGVNTGFENQIKAHVSGFLNRYEDENYDISDYIFSAQESLRAGNGIPDDLIIPSVFIKTIKKLYDEDKNYTEAITLAKRVLVKEKHLHENTIKHIRFIMCQCLARLKDSQFFSEVRHIGEPERSFLHGFFYRISGDFSKAEENLNKASKTGKRDPRVLGELILVYMQSDEFDLAHDLAKENYLNRPSNIINANNYFACLIRKEKTDNNRAVLESILSNLSIDNSDRAQEIYDSAKARLVAYYDNNESESMEIIEQAINKFPDVSYPILTKAELAILFRNKDRLSEAISALEKITHRNAQTFRSFVRFKAMHLAMQGNLGQAKTLVDRELRGLISTSFKRLHERLEYLSNKPS